MFAFAARKMLTPDSSRAFDRLRVDLICACFNGARYVEDLIRSVLAQDYPHVRLFVQDGGSTDGTLDILRKHPISWASAPDSGISQALNRAIQATEGDIVGITCADDLVTPGAVRAAVEAFEQTPHVVMVYGDCAQLDEDGRRFKRWSSQPFDLDWLFWDCYVPGQTVYLRREVLEALGGLDESLALVQDFDLWVRIAARYGSERIQYLPRVQGAYRVRPTSAGLVDPLRSIDCARRVVAKFFASPGVARLRFGPEKARAGILLQIVVSYLMARERQLAWDTYRQAVSCCPSLIFTTKGVLTVPQLVAGDGLRRAFRRFEQMLAPMTLFGQGRASS
jgi:glycosyltransferase involved in cell wall biosynthesis